MLPLDARAARLARPAGVASYAFTRRRCLGWGYSASTMAHPQSHPPLARPGEPVELDTSVAGEEDPGASIDIAAEEEDPAPEPARDADRGAPGAAGKS
jgi:hypothetical protein